MEAMDKKDVEVLYCFEAYDELVLMNLAQFERKTLKSIENQMSDDTENTDIVDKHGRHQFILSCNILRQRFW